MDDYKPQLKKRAKPKGASGAVKKKTAEGGERMAEANRFGISMLASGALCLLLSLFGLGLRGAPGGTPIVGVILLIIGGVSFASSGSKGLNNIAVNGAKIFLWGIIGMFVLVAVIATIYGLKMLMIARG